MRYWLRKYNPKTNVYSDYCGDSGPMSLFIYYREDQEPIYTNNSPPKVGGVIRVGSLIARTMSNQDWWQTSLIEEILEDYYDEKEGCRNIKFKTLNSYYHWKDYK